MSSQVVLITGGAQGIGAACVRAFLKRQFRVSVCDIRAQSERSEGSDYLFTLGDVTEPAVREHVVRRTLNEFGRIDILINCAGVGLYSTVSQTPLELAASMFDVNLMGAVGMAQQVVPAMRAQGSGAIANIGSIGGRVTLPWSTLYCASKYALHAVSEGLYRELRPDNIHVLTVIPGIVDTNFRFHVLAGTPPPGVEMMKPIPPGRVADAIVHALAARRRFVWVPRLGIPFDLLNRFLPRFVDYYCAIRQQGWSGNCAKESAPKCG